MNPVPILPGQIEPAVAPPSAASAITTNCGAPSCAPSPQMQPFAHQQNLQIPEMQHPPIITPTLPPAPPQTQPPSPSPVTQATTPVAALSPVSVTYPSGSNQMQPQQCVPPQCKYHSVHFYVSEKHFNIESYNYIICASIIHKMYVCKSLTQ